MGTSLLCYWISKFSAEESCTLSEEDGAELICEKSVSDKAVFISGICLKKMPIQVRCQMKPYQMFERFVFAASVPVPG